MALNILIIQLRRIGDVMMTTPSVRALRGAYPKARIVFLTEPPSDQIYRYSPHVDEVLRYPSRLGVGESLQWLWRVRRMKFDLVLDFFSNPRSAQLTRISGAARRIGFDYRGRRWAYTERIPEREGRHYAAAHKALLLGPLGVAVDSLLPEMPLSGAEEAYAQKQLAQLGIEQDERFVALCPVSRQPYKVWPAERYAEIADRLIERMGMKIVFIQGPGEGHFVNAVREKMRHDAAPDYPIPDLLQMAALLERAALYVGNDNGPRHFAIAVGTPTVAVFGKPFPVNWTPPDSPRHRTIDYDPGCKSNCTYPSCGHLNCINQVPLESVWEAAADQLER